MKGVWILTIYGRPRWDDGTVIECKMGSDDEPPELGKKMRDNFRWHFWPGHTLADVDAATIANGRPLAKDMKLIEPERVLLDDVPLAMLVQKTVKKGNEKRSLLDRLLRR